MAYRIELVMVEPDPPASDEGVPVEATLEEYPTMARAREAAETYLKRMDRPLGSVCYKVLDENGDEVDTVE